MGSKLNFVWKWQEKDEERDSINLDLTCLRSRCGTEFNLGWKQIRIDKVHSSSIEENKENQNQWSEKRKMFCFRVVVVVVHAGWNIEIEFKIVKLWLFVEATRAPSHVVSRIFIQSTFFLLRMTSRLQENTRGQTKYKYIPCKHHHHLLADLWFLSPAQFNALSSRCRTSMMVSWIECNCNNPSLCHTGINSLPSSNTFRPFLSPFSFFCNKQ